MGLGAICVVFEPRMGDAVRCRPWVPCVRALHSEHVRRVPFELYLESWLAELSEVMDFHQFSLKKSPHPSSNFPRSDGSLQLTLTQPCCCGK